jgi:pimeloyl-[acyl-carrier protein] methyl ester esterase
LRLGLQPNSNVKSLVLLPGLDGTGELFGDFIAALPADFETIVGRYAPDEFLDYDELLKLVQKILPARRFVVVAESFSTPLAVMLAATSPKSLAAVVLCAGFVVSPLGKRSAVAKALARPAVFRLPPPESVLKRFLLSPQASLVKTQKLKDAIRSVSPDVLARRAQMVLSCDARSELARLKVPLLYIQGSRDAVVGKKSFLEIRKAKPDAELGVIDAPHLILQSEPQAAAKMIMRFVGRLSS